MILIIHPKITQQLKNGPKIWATGEVSIVPDTTNQLRIDNINIIDIDKIEMMDIEIIGHNKINNFINNFRSVDIDLYEIMENELKEYIAMSSTIDEFIKNETDYSLTKIK
jgi:hypothetical protein